MDQDGVESLAGKPGRRHETSSSGREEDSGDGGSAGVSHCALCHCPTGLSTSSQLLFLKNSSFLRSQRHLKTAISSLYTTNSYQCLQQFSALLGFTFHSKALPWIVFSESDPLAQQVLASALGGECGVAQVGVTLLDRLDMAEVVKDCICPSKPPDSSADNLPMCSSGIGQDSVLADMAFSSLLRETEPLAQLALASAQSLFQSLIPIPNPESTAADSVSSHAASVPVPFQRVCLLLRQHLHWIPTTCLDRLPWQWVGHYHGCVIRTCTIGPQSKVVCVGVSSVPIDALLRWYQQASLLKQLHLQLEPTTSDIQRLLTHVLTLQC